MSTGENNQQETTSNQQNPEKSEELKSASTSLKEANSEVQKDETRTQQEETLPSETELKEALPISASSSIELPQQEMSQTIQNEPAEVESLQASVNEDKEELEEEILEEENEDETEDQDFIDENEDLAEFSKKDLLTLADKLVDAVKKQGITLSEIKNIDNVTKQILPVFDELQIKEKGDALKNYISENGSEDGFEFKNDNITIRFEAASAIIRDQVAKFYRNLRQSREDYFEVKTGLLDRLRVVVEEEEKGGSKENWVAFKTIQDEWKDAGNVSSPHNGSLWSAYNALIDRYFSIRSIQNELKDLDRRKNLESKTELVLKIESIADQLKIEGYSSALFKEANTILEEYKLIGPATREEQEMLWERVKSSFDSIYEKKREQNEVNKQLQNEILEAKKRIVENLKPFLEFNSTSINEWNAKTKEILAFQDQWNEIKGLMPRTEGKIVSKDFWSSLKQFFKNKSEFFNRLEAEREENLKAKNALYDELDSILASNITDANTTNRVIEIQKTWRTIGHVPQKYKDSVYKKFKALADKFFNNKRTENSDVEKEYEENLKAKIAICEEVEKLTEKGNVDLSLLPGFKKEYGKIGFVPRKNIKSIQARFIDAINNYVRASSDLTKKDEENLLLKNQVEVVLKSGNSSVSLTKQENDLKRKAQTLESDISLWRNNIEFFGHSKGAEKMKAEFEKKIVKAENELKALNEKLKMFSSLG